MGAARADAVGALTAADPAMLRAAAEVIGAMAGCGAGELLASTRVPSTNDPLGMLFPLPAPAPAVTR